MRRVTRRLADGHREQRARVIYLHDVTLESSVVLAGIGMQCWIRNGSKN